MTILPGVAVWSELPDMMAIHFNLNNEADNFAHKSFVVFGLPVLMTLIQIFCCFINDINAAKHGERKKFEIITKSIIPILTIILQIMTLSYGLGHEFDIRRIVAFLVGTILMVIGNYQPKLDYVRDAAVDTQKARKINRFVGVMTVLMGAVFVISVILPPIATIVSVYLLIPYAILCVLYGIKVGLKKE